MSFDLLKHIFQLSGYNVRFLPGQIVKISEPVGALFCAEIRKDGTPATASESAKKSGVKPPCALAPSFVVVGTRVRRSDPHGLGPGGCGDS